MEASQIESTSLLLSLFSFTTIFVIAILVSQAITKALHKQIFRVTKLKKVNKLIKDGWKPVGYTSYGYPTTFMKETALQVI